MAFVKLRWLTIWAQLGLSCSQHRDSHLQRDVLVSSKAESMTALLVTSHTQLIDQIGWCSNWNSGTLSHFLIPNDLFKEAGFDPLLCSTSASNNCILASPFSLMWYHTSNTDENEASSSSKPPVRLCVHVCWSRAARVPRGTYQSYSFLIWQSEGWSMSIKATQQMSRKAALCALSHKSFFNQAYLKLESWAWIAYQKVWVPMQS